MTLFGLGTHSGSEDGRWGCYRLDKCDRLTQAFALKQMAEKPRRLRGMA